MKNTKTKLCIAILVLCFLSVVAGVVLSALGTIKTEVEFLGAEMAGNIAGMATALCAVGWFLAMRNLRLADEGDFSSEGRKSKVTEKLFSSPVPLEISPVEDSEGIPESEWL